MNFSPTPSMQDASPQSQSQTPPQSTNGNGHGHEHHAGPVTKSKRARPTISCLECRRKKLKCDRVQPCMQCTKAGKDSLCTFASPPVPPKSKGVLQHRPAENPNKRPKFQEFSSLETSTYSESKIASAPVGSTNLLRPAPVWDRFAQNEEYRGDREDDVTDDCPWLDDTNEAKQNSDPDRRSLVPGEKRCLGKIYINNGRSRFLGVSDRMVILDHFTKAREFVKAGCKDPDVYPPFQEMMGYQKLVQTLQPVYSTVVARPACSSADRADLMSEMIDSLPSGYACSMVNSIYSGHFDSLMRVIHFKSFIRDACAVVQLRECRPPISTLPNGIRGSVVPQLLATIVLSTRMVKSIAGDMGKSAEENIQTWTCFIQRWVYGSNSKERSTLESLRTHVMLVLVYQCNLIPASELWEESGKLVRSAMIMGLHIDPEGCDGLTLFGKEQRRKLWRTIVELDIQFSLAAGMPTAVRATDIDLRKLRNVDDTDLKEDMMIYPECKDTNEWTDSTYQIILGYSLRERLDAVNILGGTIDLEHDAASLLMRAKSLERHLNLPDPIRSDTISLGNIEKSSSNLFTKILLDVYIRRPSVALYRAVAFSPFSDHYPAARTAAVESSIAILSHIDALDPTVADPNTIKDRNLLNVFHVLCKNDIIQAALNLCFEIRRYNAAMLENKHVHNEVSWTNHSLTRIVDNTLNSLIDRVSEFGGDLMNILPLSVVLQSVRSDGTIESIRSLVLKTTDRLLQACKTLLPPLIPPMPQVPDTLQPPSDQGGQAYWTPESLPTPPSLQTHAQYTGYPAVFGSPNMMGNGVVDFQNFDFGFSHWDMEQSWQ